MNCLQNFFGRLFWRQNPHRSVEWLYFQRSIHWRGKRIFVRHGEFQVTGELYAIDSGRHGFVLNGIFEHIIKSSLWTLMRLCGSNVLSVLCSDDLAGEDYKNSLRDQQVSNFCTTCFINTGDSYGNGWRWNGGAEIRMSLKFRINRSVPDCSGQSQVGLKSVLGGPGRIFD